MSDDQPAAPDAAAQTSLQPDAMGPRQRRRHERAHIDLVVTLRFESVQEFMDAKAGDISLGGMFLRSEHAGPGGELRTVGQLLVLNFDAGNQLVVEGLARVVRVVTPDEPGMVAGVGLEFLDLDARSQALIEAIIAIRSAKPFGE